MAQPELNDASERRVNEMLRLALVKFLQGEHGRVNEFDVYLFRAARDKIDALGNPSPMQQRLRDLVERALAQYPDLAMRLTEIARADPASPIENALQAATLFEGMDRIVVPDLAGLPLGAALRVYEHAGPLTVQGDLPEDTLVIVREGGLVVHGTFQGHGLAEEDIRVFGNIQGGCVVSTHGDIEVGRVLSGARLAAPRGSIRAASIERPGHLFAAAQLEVAGDVLGARCHAGTIKAGGTIRASDLAVLHALEAGGIEGDARAPTRIVFRRVMSAKDFGRELPEEAAGRLRVALRAHFGAVAGAALIAALHAEWCNAQRALLYHLADSNTAPPLEALRSAQLTAAHHGWHAAAAEALLQMTQEALEADPDLLRGAATQAAEDCEAMVRALEQDLGAVPDDIARAAKEPLVSAGKQLASLARKIQEAAQRGEPIDEYFESLVARKVRWRAAADQALKQLEAWVPALTTAMGDAARPGQPGDQISVLARLEMEKAKRDEQRAKRLESLIGRTLVANVERAQAGLAQWTRQTAESRTTWEEARAILCGEGWLLAPPDPRGPRFARATQWSAGVVVSATPMAAAQDDSDRAMALRLALPVEQPTTFHVEGQLVRRDPPRRGERA